MRPGFGRLASLDEAKKVLFERLPVLGVETVPLRDALGRVLASDIEAAIDVPHFAKAAMDGYAVLASSTFGASSASQGVLRVEGVIAPGDIRKEQVTAEICFEVGTGVAMPEGADAVVMVEFTEAAGQQVNLVKPVAPGENVHQVGSDIKAGEVVLKNGTFLEPRHLGVLAAIGVDRVRVSQKPKVALFSTGAELLAPGAELQPGKVFDINSHTLEAALGLDGCEVVDLGVVPDTSALLEAAVRKGLEAADLVLLSGGSSLGGGDLVQEVFESVGTLLVHGVAVKPGKPLVLAAAETPGSAAPKIMIGLPGYPMSALSDYYIFVRPFVRRAMGMRGEPRTGRVEATMAHKQPSPLGRYEFLPVRLRDGKAYPVSGGSSSIAALASADGFIEIDELTEMVAEGETVLVRGF